MLGSLALLAAVTIPPYPRATALCSQHLTGAPTGGQPGPHITWTAYYTTDPPATVVAWYQRQLPGLHRHEGKEDVFRVPAAEPEAVVSIAAVADAPPPVAACKERPPATARTIVLMSTMQRGAAERRASSRDGHARPPLIARLRLSSRACPTRRPGGLSTTSSSSAAGSSAAASPATPRCAG